MARVEFRESGIEVECDGDRSLLDCALAAAVVIDHICGGDGACGTCRVEILEGWDHLTPRTQDEIGREIDRPYRLACQTRANSNTVVKVASVE